MIFFGHTAAQSPQPLQRSSENVTLFIQFLQKKLIIYDALNNSSFDRKRPGFMLLLRNQAIIGVYFTDLNLSIQLFGGVVDAEQPVDVKTVVCFALDNIADKRQS